MISPLSWLIAVLILVLIYTFLRVAHRRPCLRPFLRRRSRRAIAAFQLHVLPELQPHLPFPDAGGLDLSAIAAIPVYPFASLRLLSSGRLPSDCAVCLSHFEDHETLRFIPNCRHAFHPTCLDPWLAAHTTCPSCRATITPAAPEHSHDVVIAVGYSTESGGGGFTLGSHFWKQKAPLRLKILVCRVLSGGFPIDRRQQCALCGVYGESAEHLFFRCDIARALWYDFWGIRTDGATTEEWTAANWVEAALFPSRLDLAGEGEMFLFMGCLMDKIWRVRNRVVGGEEEGISVEGVRAAVANSFRELRRAFCVSSGGTRNSIECCS